MKKAIGIFSLFMVTLFLTGNYFIYKSVLQNHKREFIGQINAHIKDIETIEISPYQLFNNSEDLKWLDDNDEINYKGMVYDVLKISTMGTKVVLHVVSDINEMELISFVNKQLGDIYQTNNNNKNNSNLLKDFLSLEFFSAPIESILLFIQNYTYPLLNDTYLVFDYLPVNIQPPRV